MQRNKIIFYIFYVWESFKEINWIIEIASYKNEIYFNLSGLIKIQQRNELSATRLNDLYLHVSLFTRVLKKIIIAAKISTSSIEFFKKMSNEDGEESSDEDEEE